MFDIKSLTKIKSELLASVIDEATKKITDLPKKYISNAKKTFLVYKKENSIAGLEYLINSIYEYLYFFELQEELKNNQNNFIEYKKFLLTNLKEDFGKEDFRFIKLESSKNDFKSFNNDIQKILNENISNFQKPNSKFIPTIKNEFSHYHKAESDPSIDGVDVKMKIVKTPKEKINQIFEAKSILKNYYKEGFDLFELLTYKIIIISSKNLVSYSHFGEQGISYINFIDRNLIESIDDLVHENSHHHLNLILKKYKILKKEENEEIFYSPWRKELRSIYAILHSVFTFSYGSMLFFELISKIENGDKFFSDESYIYLRFLEEVYSVQYSLIDLEISIKQNKFSTQGIKLINFLKMKNLHFLDSISKFKKMKLIPEHKEKISKLKIELAKSRKKYILAKND